MELDTHEDDFRIPEESMKKMMEIKYRKIYSEILDRKVYTLRHHLSKDLFKKYKKQFGYADVGWTVKHPKRLIQLLLLDGIWEVPEDEPEENSQE